jgi:cation diffusion facilitator CzcD-associated flavoprotein CzcO
LFSKQAEIKQYTNDIVQKYKIASHIQCNTELLSCKWIADQNQWEIQTTQKTYRAQFVIMACGPMYVPIIPTIKGVESFKGDYFHSAQWNHDIDLTGKRVVMVGSGASAIQFVLAIQEKVKPLTLFQRSAPWVLPKIDVKISTTWKKVFRYLPFVQTLFRNTIYL